MRYVATHTRPKPRPDTLGLRLGVSLLLVTVSLAVRQWDPALLEPVRVQLLSNSGQVAETFARFTGALSRGEPMVDAWAELRTSLAQEYGIAS